MSDQACETRPEEIAEHRRCCWAPDCKKTARLEWCGWRYCIPHFWTYVLAGQSTWGHLWVKLRWTEIARHKRRNSTHPRPALVDQGRPACGQGDELGRKPTDEGYALSRPAQNSEAK